MKTVLCYGDSLTWGYSAEPLGRHAFADRWPSVLAEELGPDVQVIAEGLNGRTTAYDDHLADCDRNGARILPTILHSHDPIDLVVIMLGANDMKPDICGSAIGAKQGMERLIGLVRHHVFSFPTPVPDLVLVAPPPLCQPDDADFQAMFGGGIGESLKLAEMFNQLAKQYDCGFFDAGSVTHTTPIDGVHLDVANTRALGRALAPPVRERLHAQSR